MNLSAVFTMGWVGGARITEGEGGRHVRRVWPFCTAKCLSHGALAQQVVVSTSLVGRLEVERVYLCNHHALKARRDRPRTKISCLVSSSKSSVLRASHPYSSASEHLSPVDECETSTLRGYCPTLNQVGYACSTLRADRSQPEPPVDVGTIEALTILLTERSGPQSQYVCLE